MNITQPNFILDRNTEAQVVKRHPPPQSVMKFKIAASLLSRADFLWVSDGSVLGEIRQNRRE